MNKKINKLDELSLLALKYDCDKYGAHFYTPIYYSYLNNIKNRKNIIFEIGVGGYDNPNKGGASLYMWKDFFVKSNIYSMDIFSKKNLEKKRIKIFKGSQFSKIDLTKILKKIGTPNVIIDDGSHINKHVIFSFKFLFPFLQDGGLYFIEDTQTSYWPNMGGNSFYLKDDKTIMNYFKSLTDHLNIEEMDNPFINTNDAINIDYIHFYHNLIVIKKSSKKSFNKSIFVNNNIFPVNGRYLKIKMIFKYLNYYFYFFKLYFNKLLDLLKL